jgi:hypothetical protein
MSSTVIYVLMINEIPRPAGTTDLHKKNSLQVHNIVKHPKESVDSVFFGQKATSGFYLWPSDRVCQQYKALTQDNNALRKFSMLLRLKPRRCSCPDTTSIFAETETRLTVRDVSFRVWMTLAGSPHVTSAP